MNLLWTLARETSGSASQGLGALLYVAALAALVWFGFGWAWRRGRN